MVWSGSRINNSRTPGNWSEPLSSYSKRIVQQTLAARMHLKNFVRGGTWPQELQDQFSSQGTNWSTPQPHTACQPLWFSNRSKVVCTTQWLKWLRLQTSADWRFCSLRTRTSRFVAAVSVSSLCWVFRRGFARSPHVSRPMVTCALLVARLVGLSVAHLLSLGLLMIWCLVPFMPGVCLGFVVRAMFLLSPILN